MTNDTKEDTHARRSSVVVTYFTERLLILLSAQIPTPPDSTTIAQYMIRKKFELIDMYDRGVTMFRGCGVLLARSCL